MGLSLVLYADYVESHRLIVSARFYQINGLGYVF